MEKFNYDTNYQNNCFNAKLSQLLDKKRTIMDIDCFLYKLGCQTKIMYDHKKTKDKTSLAALKGYAFLVSENFHCFIVRNELDDTGNIINNDTVIYEIKALKDVKDLKNKSDFLKNTYILTNEDDIKLFFQVETHNNFKRKYKENEDIKKIYNK
tara:strand:- start:42 stop:503 length:462 start_codon:yes stop_codon:yes gene_type:complete